MLEGRVEPPETKRVGIMLQQRRVRSGFDLAEVSRYLHIRRVYLEAIEQGCFDALPGPAYAAGFVRTYAGFLGLNAEAMVDRLRRENGAVEAAAPLNFRVPVAEGNTPKAGVLLIGAVIALLAYGGWYVSTARGPDVAQLTTPIAQRTAPADEARAMRLSAQETASAEPVAPAGAPVPRAGTGDVALFVSPLSPQQPDAAPTPHVPAAPAATTALAAEPPDGGLTSPADAAARIVLRAKTDSWVEVRDTQSNSLLIGRLLRPGEAYAVPDRPGLRLITGNAGGLLVFVDGEAVPPLDKEGAVRRGVGLDPDELRRVAESGLTQ